MHSLPSPQWESAVDPALLHRLLQRRDRPGVAGARIAHVVLSTTRMLPGLPLLERFAGRAGARPSGEQTPIVLAHPPLPNDAPSVGPAEETAVVPAIPGGPAGSSAPGDRQVIPPADSPIAEGRGNTPVLPLAPAVHAPPDRPAVAAPLPVRPVVKVRQAPAIMLQKAPATSALAPRPKVAPLAPPQGETGRGGASGPSGTTTGSRGTLAGARGFAGFLDERGEAPGLPSRPRERGEREILHRDRRAEPAPLSEARSAPGLDERGSGGGARLGARMGRGSSTREAPRPLLPPAPGAGLPMVVETRPWVSSRWAPSPPEGTGIPLPVAPPAVTPPASAPWGAAPVAMDHGAVAPPGVSASTLLAPRVRTREAVPVLPPEALLPLVRGAVAPARVEADAPPHEPVGATGRIAPLSTLPSTVFPAPPGPESRPERASPTEIAGVADQVYQLLVRRLARERKQRGW